MIGRAGEGRRRHHPRTRLTALSERVRRLTGAARPQHELRDYGIGAQILSIRHKGHGPALEYAADDVGMEGYGLRIVDQHRTAMMTPPRATIDAPLPSAPRIAGPRRTCCWCARRITARWWRHDRGRRPHPARGGATSDMLDVAGAFELPQAIRLALRGATRFDGFVALGCVCAGRPTTTSSCAGRRWPG